jgi:hypothetical protein
MSSNDSNSSTVSIDYRLILCTSICTMGNDTDLDYSAIANSTFPLRKPQVPQKMKALSKSRVVMSHVIQFDTG